MNKNDNNDNNVSNDARNRQVEAMLKMLIIYCTVDDSAIKDINGDDLHIDDHEDDNNEEKWCVLFFPGVEMTALDVSVSKFKGDTHGHFVYVISSLFTQFFVCKIQTLHILIQKHKRSKLMTVGMIAAFSDVSSSWSKKKKISPI